MFLAEEAIGNTGWGALIAAFILSVGGAIIYIKHRWRNTDRAERAADRETQRLQDNADHIVETERREREESSWERLYRKLEKTLSTRMDVLERHANEARAAHMRTEEECSRMKGELAISKLKHEACERDNAQLREELEQVRSRLDSCEVEIRRDT